MEIFHDIRVDVTTTKKGCCKLSSGAQIMEYLLKNCRHFPTCKSLGRCPVRLVNISEGSQIYQFFVLMFRDFRVVIDGVPSYDVCVPSSNAKQSDSTIKEYITTSFRQLEDKKLETFLKENSKEFHQNINTKTSLFIFDFVKDEMTPENAWKIIKFREQSIIDDLNSGCDAKYILSTIEINDTDMKEDFDPSLFHEKYVGYVKRDEGANVYFDELIRVFSERDENLQISPSEDGSEKIIRMLKFFMKYRKDLEEIIRQQIDIIESEQKIPETIDYSWYKSIYDQLEEMGNGVLQDMENPFGKYPRLIVIIAYSSEDDSKDILKELGLVTFRTLLYNKDKINEEEIRFASDSRMLEHVLKNSRYLQTYTLLQRNPTRLVNISKNPEIDEFFIKLNDTKAIIIDEISDSVSRSEASSSSRTSSQKKRKIKVSKEVAGEYAQKWLFEAIAQGFDMNEGIKEYQNVS
jgi:hypothetical protein